MDSTEGLARLSSARVGILATVRPGGGPHLVPVVFAAEGEALVTAVDHKPKTTPHLQRLTNIRTNPHVSLLAHGYTEDWSRLWWERADGTARILEAGPGRDTAIAALVEKYPQYRDRPPPGPVIRVTVDQIVTWTASGS